MPVSDAPRKGRLAARRRRQRSMRLRQALESTRCESPQGWMLIICEAGSEYWRPKRCRNCEGCAAAARKAVEFRIKYGMEVLQDCLFITLTSVPGATWQRLCTLWTRLVARIRKRYGPASYAVVKQEGSDTGMCHFHAVVGGPRFIPYEWLSAWWEKHSKAFMVWIEKASPDTAEELSQYLVRGVNAKGKVSYKKGVTFSKCWPKPPRCATRVVGEDLTHTMPTKAECILWLPTLRLVVAPTRRCYCGQHAIFHFDDNDA